MYTVAVVTGTRAEYGLLRPVLEKLKESDTMQARLVVTGAHLSRAFGYTISEIEADGHTVDARLDILSQPVPPGRAGTARRMSLALEGLLSLFGQSRPDVLLALGDRYEMLAAGQAAALLDIPVAHISGGDVTHGADDDWFRHCLTKMAKLHFPSCEAYRRRVIRMGEHPGRVFNVGGLGDENIRSLPLMDREALSASLGIPLPEQFVLVTFHPETVSSMPAARQIEVLLAAVAAHPELFYLFTAAGADAGGAEINRAVEVHCAAAQNAAFVPSMGVLRYLSAMQHAALVLGNSSSGVVETPSFGVPTVDVGSRQAGRETGGNVLHCPLAAQPITDTITDALDLKFARRARETKSPYNGGDTSGKIVRILGDFLQTGALAGPKLFYDAKEGAEE